MKTILSILILLAVSTASFGQLSTTLVSQYSATVDTVDNTETLYLSLTTGANSSVGRYWKSGTIVFKALEISGTGGGTATLEVSSNGIDFATIPTLTSYTIIDQTAAQTVSWRLTDVAFKSFRIKVTGSGTMSYKIYGSAFLAN